MLTWGHADKLTALYPIGKTVHVFYRPESPELSCLEPGGVAWEDIFMLLVGVFGVIWGLKNLYLCCRWLSHRILTPRKLQSHR